MKPLIGISCCTTLVSPRDSLQHAASDSYVRVVDRLVMGVPVLLPANGESACIGTLVDRLDGLILTGSYSNVHPELYGGTPPRAGTREDVRRDAVTLRLAQAAVAAGLPLLAICRGFQELNVAFGGTLHQHLRELPGRLDHSTPEDADERRRCAKRHVVMLSPGGLLHRLAGRDTSWVNSLHNQGIDRLAPGLAVEARAPDGVIEAVRVAGAGAMAIGLQWHPELDCDSDPLSAGLFASFSRAVAARRSGSAVRSRTAA